MSWVPISDLPELPIDCQWGHWFPRVQNVGIHLQSKGFCVLKGNLASSMLYKARAEVDALKGCGAFDRTPREVLPALFGEQMSCWTMTLPPPDPKGREMEPALRRAEQQLLDLGSTVAAGGSQFMGYSVRTRSLPILHMSKTARVPRDETDLVQMRNDRGPPSLFELDEALGYIKKSQERRVIALYWLGPGKASATIELRDDRKRKFEALIPDGGVLLYRTDIIKIKLEAKDDQRNCMMEMDFPVMERQNLAERNQELLDAPESLQNWCRARVETLTHKQAWDELPSDLVKEDILDWKAKKKAAGRSVPVRLVKTYFDLPSLVRLDGRTTPFEAALLGGQDCVTEIRSTKDGDLPAFGAKWDVEAYYDEDPANVQMFKMYTRHLAVLNRDDHEEFKMEDYKLNPLQNVTLDPKHKLIAQATMKVVTLADTKKSELAGEPVGFFVGVSGNNDQIFNCLSRQTKINQYTWQNMGNAAMVSRLAFIMDTTGPCQAVDTEDSGGLAAVDAAVSSLRTDVSAPAAIASSVSYISNPFQLIMLCAAGMVSRSGRSRPFDESCDGFAKGEGVVSMFLEIHSDLTVRNEGMPLMRTTKGPRGVDALIVGSALSAMGFGAPTPSSLQALFEKCAKDAGTSHGFIDAMDLHAGGQRELDELEASAVMRRTLVRDRAPSPVIGRSHKANYGNLGAPSGMVALLRTSSLIRRGLHGPTIHLRQTFVPDLPDAEIPEEVTYTWTSDGIAWMQSNDARGFGFPLEDEYVPDMLPGTALRESTMANWKAYIRVLLKEGRVKLAFPEAMPRTEREAIEESIFDPKVTRLQFITEALQARSHNQLVGVNSFSSTGTNVSMLVAGHLNWDDKLKLNNIPTRGKSAYWFPGGSTGIASRQILSGFYIVGSWTNFEIYQRMEQEDVDGQYGFTVTLGENCFETFQIVQDEDKDQIFHPAYHHAGKHVPVAVASGDNKMWLIDGRDKPKRLVNEEMYEKLKSEGAVEAESSIVAYKNNFVAPEATSTSWDGQPLVILNEEDVGVPGDKYRVQFKTRGRYMDVSWTKIEAGVAALALPDKEAAFEHKYTIIGDHNYWKFDEMIANEDEPGLFTIDIQLLREKSCFQVYRNGDFDQGFHPARKRETDMNARFVGPDGDGLGYSWMIEGKVGDIVRVEFRRKRDQGKDTRSIKWKRTGFDDIDWEGKALVQKWYVLGSMTRRDTWYTIETQEMQRTEDGNYVLDFPMSFCAKEKFQILMDNNFLCSLRPREDEGSMFDIDGTMEGPDDEGYGKYWNIGTHPEDPCGQGGVMVRIHLDMNNGQPQRVWWEPYECEASHRLYLAAGCQNTFDRHCRMLGFVPNIPMSYVFAEQPGRPDFMQMKPGETMTSLKHIQGPGCLGRPGLWIGNEIEQEGAEPMPKPRKGLETQTW